MTSRTVEQRLAEVEGSIARILHGEAVLIDPPELAATIDQLWHAISLTLAALFAIFLLVVVLSFRVGIR